jgi:CHAD domain-containing protein
MKNRPAQAICSYGAGVIFGYAAALRQEIPGVRLGQDIEAIHRMRVASRRIRSALPLFETCYPQKYRLPWQKEIRQVTRALGNARDTDVQIDRLQKCLESVQDIHLRPGVRRLILRLTQKRFGLQAKVILALDELEKSQALTSLEEQTQAKCIERGPGEPYSFALYQLAKQAILSSLERLMSYEPFIYNPDNIAELHAMRIASKQLRYTLEIFGPLYGSQLKNIIQTVKLAQEMLGDIHDCDVWSTLLPEFLELERARVVKFYGNAGPFKMLIPGISFFQQDRRQFRDQVYKDYVENWENWKQTEVWGSLFQIIDLPTKHGSDQFFYPAASVTVQDEASSSIIVED